MKGIKLLCFSLLAAIGFAFAGESFILYLTTFESQCIYTEFYNNASPNGTKENMVSDIIKESKNNNIGIFKAFINLYVIKKPQTLYTSNDMYPFLHIYKSL